MMRMWKGIGLLLVFLLLGCTPVLGEEPVALLDGEKQVTAEAGATKPAELENATEDSEELEPVLQVTGELEGETTMADLARPSEVELAGVTPAPVVEGEEAVIQPEPGEPNLAQAMAHRAAVALAEQLGIGVEKIDIVSIEAVQWPDSSLGCPKPGRSYLTVITPGFRVILEADGERYAYHTDQNRAVVRCEGRPGGGEAFPER